MKLLVGAAAASALALTALASAPAQALNESHSEVYHSHYGYAGTGCTYTAVTKPTSAQTNVDLPVLGGSKSVTTTETDVVKGSSGAAVANVTTSLSSRASFTTAGGGFKSFTATESASASFSKAATSAACGGTATRLATASPRAKYAVQLPTATAGWLDISATAPESASSHGTYGYTVELSPPGATDYNDDKFADVDVLPGGSASTHVYVGRGWTVMVYATASLTATLEYPDRPQNRSGSGSVTVSGTFTPAGSAATGLVGPTSARKAVSLPSALACNGTARIGLAKTGKKTKQIALTVNGRVVKRLKKVTRATAVNVRVPASGRVTLGATVTSKKGAKAAVTRSYVACH